MPLVTVFRGHNLPVPVPRTSPAPNIVNATFDLEVLVRWRPGPHRNRYVAHQNLMGMYQMHLKSWRDVTARPPAGPPVHARWLVGLAVPCEPNVRNGD